MYNIGSICFLEGLCPAGSKNRGVVDASLSPGGSHSAFGASAAPTLKVAKTKGR